MGVRYYNGIAVTNEVVVCKREPANQYDPNAIRVDNVLGRQIGHIPRTVAAKLAPYIVSPGCHWPRPQYAHTKKGPR